MSLPEGGFEAIRKSLLGWFEINKREMPWRDSRDPYAIWLSEVMLQQTRVDQATPYFQKFMAAFPKVADLANADQHDVLMLWEGLGYYARGRNLHKAAKVVADDYGGRFPASYEKLLSLPGVGPYTAAAIASIAFGGKHAVVDGNVIRVLSRFFGITDDVSSGRTKRTIQELADELLDPQKPGDFNQAVMELGSLVCSPSIPKCDECPLGAWCVAHKTLQTSTIPYKAPKSKVPHHDIVVAVISDAQGRLLIARRPETAMLGGLWEFPGGKIEKGETLEQALIREIREELGVQIAIRRDFMVLKHAYSHFKITLHAYLCDLESGNPEPRSSSELRWVLPQQLADFPFPKANRRLTVALMEQFRG